jgi:hypothetical protein
MDRKLGYFIILPGLVIGIIFGMGIGAANGNPLFGIGIGALGGVFIGWFVAAIAFEKQSTHKINK